MANAYDEELKRQAMRLPAIQRDTIAEILRLLRVAQAQVIAELAGATPSATVRLERQQQAINAAIRRFTAGSDAALQAGLDTAWQAGTELLTLPLAAGTGIAPVLRIDDRALLAMRSFTTDRIKDVGLKAVDRINGVLGQVLIGTTPLADAITHIQDILGGESRRRAQTIAYTNLGTAYSTASNEAMLEAERVGVKLAKRWLKSGKAHPRPSHVVAHNQIVRVSESFRIVDQRTGEIEMLRFPRDPKASAGNVINCGCLSIPVVDGSTFGASVIEIPDDPRKPVRKVSRARRDADSRAYVERVDDRLQRFLRSDLGAGAGMRVTRDSAPGQPATLRMVKAPFIPARAAWPGGETVLIHALDEALVRSHKAYAAAKVGDLAAAAELIERFASGGVVDQLRAAIGRGAAPRLLPVYAEEAGGRNPIPLALARWLGVQLGWEVETGIIQANRVFRTRTDGYYRLAMQPLFTGPVAIGRRYVLVDDFIGQGATLANLRGHVLAGGGKVTGFTSLTGKAVSANLGLQPATLAALRARHGEVLENWWRDTFGFGFDALTESEARYLLRYPDADRIRAEVAARFGKDG